MAKSKAQRMREYRQKKKEQLGDSWLKAERERVRGYFVPIADLDDEARERKRERNKIRQARFRNKRRVDKANEASVANVNNMSNDIQQPSTSENVVSSSSDSVLTVKMPFVVREKVSIRGRKRSSRALAKSYRTIETLQDRNEELKRKLKSAQKRLQRYENRVSSANTPKSKSDNLLKRSGINPKDVPEVRKKLILGECLSEEIKTAKNDQEGNSAKAQIVHRVASGKVIKKYRMKSTLEKVTNLNRRRNIKNKNVLPIKRKRLDDLRKRVNDKIQTFLERDDNSRQLPGKGDAVKAGNKKIQKRVLNDYMYNLHLKFNAESDIKVSRTTFYKARPKYVSLVNFTSRSVCLCSKHQNFCFLLRSLKCLNVTSCTNPDKFVELYQDSPAVLNEMLDKIPEGEEVKFQQWKRVKLQNGKEKQRVVEVKTSKADFVEMMLETFQDFKNHIQRVKQQYAAVSKMKECLPKDQVLIQMDFSENYSCSTLEEIQSAYWNSSMVTLHPAVIYYRGEFDELKHTSYVHVSEVLNHNASMVICIINSLINIVKAIIPNVTSVHFWTDSPSSQYRNKTIFDLVSRFRVEYGVKASWHYFESGHGKGPCDGVGGTTKRNADNAVKQGKVLIQDASDFYAWATQNEQGIRYEFVTEEDYNLTKINVDERNSKIKPVKGCMKIHAVVGTNDGTIAVRNTSCACSNCFDGSFNIKSPCTWEEHRIELKGQAGKGIKLTDSNEKPNQSCKPATVDSVQIVHEVINENIEVSVNSSKSQEDIPSKHNDMTSERAPFDMAAEIDGQNRQNDFDIEVNKLVVAKYDDMCYIGKVIEVCDKDNTVNITFMTECGKSKGKYKWPIVEDKVWLKKGDVVRLIHNPIPTSKTGRMFTFEQDILQMLSN